MDGANVDTLCDNGVGCEFTSGTSTQHKHSSLPISSVIRVCSHGNACARYLQDNCGFLPNAVPFCREYER
jgi:hypothetical protein